jgi:hypothetical protein
MTYEGIEFVIRVGLGRNEWSLLIYYPDNRWTMIIAYNRDPPPLLLGGVDHLHTTIFGGERIGWILELRKAVSDSH